jgi:hypothetical protein
VLTIRNEQFIDAARAVGLNSPQILSRHVLPNLMGTLVAMAALEMGRVLLLLGELGFVYVFVGGGRGGYSEASRTVAHYFDIPDWGAMLGTSWRWFRSYPWFPLAPATAFFVAIVGFNLFGYGLQRFIERGRFHPSGWSVLRFLVVVALILVGARTLVLGTGVEAQFADMASALDGERAMADVVALSDSSLEGDPNATAQYIAAQFRAAGLSPATPQGEYVQTYVASRGRVTDAPALEVVDENGEVQLSLDEGLSFDPWQAFNNQGTREAELLISANTNQVREKGVVLLVDPDQKLHRRWSGSPLYDGILRVVPDGRLGSQDQAPEFDMTSFGRVEMLPDFPNLLIGESAARQLLATAGLDLDELQDRAATGEELSINTGVQVRLNSGLVYEETEGYNVVGYIAGMDMGSRGERILVTAGFGRGYPGADENASGLAAMIEMARTLQEMEFIPKRTIAFAAFDDGGGFDFVTSPPLPTSRSEVWTTISLQGIAAGGEKLARSESGPGLARAFDQSARRVGARTEDWDNWRFFYITNGSRLSWGDPEPNSSYQGVAVTRIGDDLSGGPDDTAERLDMAELSEAAQAALHFVMVTSFR